MRLGIQLSCKRSGQPKTLDERIADEEVIAISVQAAQTVEESLRGDEEYAFAPAIQHLPYKESMSSPHPILMG